MGAAADEQQRDRQDRRGRSDSIAEHIIHAARSYAIRRRAEAQPFHAVGLERDEGAVTSVADLARFDPVAECGFQNEQAS
jgi:hypothetical protein